ncbi:MAG: hypothetical protein WBG65_03900 [Sulfurimonadaceae bacterium]
MENVIEMERSILCTVLFAYIISDEHSEAINAFKLSDEYFVDDFHKMVARVLVWLRNNDKHVTDDAVIFYLQKYKQMDENKMLQITAHNWLGLKTYSMYYDLLKENTQQSLIGDL